MCREKVPVLLELRLLFHGQNLLNKETPAARKRGRRGRKKHAPKVIALLYIVEYSRKICGELILVPSPFELEGLC